MLRKLIYVISGGLIIALILGVAYWWGTPRLTSTSPKDETEDVLTSESIHMVFSCPVQPHTVEERLDFHPALSGSFYWSGKELIFTPDQHLESGKFITVQLAPGAQCSGLLPLPMREGYRWSFSVRQPRLLYLFPAKGPSNLYQLNPETGKSEPVTNVLDGVLGFDASQNGRWIIYSVRDGQKGSVVYRKKLLSSAQTLQPESESEGLAFGEVILDCPEALCSTVAISPEGDFLAYERIPLPGSGQPAYPQVWIVTLPPSEESTDDNPKPVLAGQLDHQTIQPAWSSDGFLAFYDSTSAAFNFLDWVGNNQVSFPNQTGEPGDWSPDGRSFVVPEIFFLDTNISPELSNLERFADSHLIQYNIQSGVSQDLTAVEGIEDTSPVFSGDGFQLAFARKYLEAKKWTPGRQIWLMDTVSHQAKQLTNDPIFNHFDFAWSPSGKKLAYVKFNQSSLTEPPEIWILDLVSNQTSRLIVDGYAPAWIP